MLKIFRTAVVVSALLTTTVALAPAPAAAAPPSFDRPVAYVRAGNIYLSTGATERRVTTGGGHSRPRWSADGRRMSFVRGGHLWVMNADGTGKRRLSTRSTGGAAWSPDGRWIAFAATGCTGGAAIYRISTTTAGAQPEPLFPTECRGEVLPADFPGEPATGTLAERLRRDNAVAWSPDGSRIAFRGGMCESVYDDCLTLGTVATGGERVLAAYGGGGQEYSGFAVVPAFRADGAKITWTGHQIGHDAATTLPVHVVEHDLATGAKRRVGAAQDREMVYASATRGLITGQYKGKSWVLVVDLNTGKRTAFHKGSQPSIRP